MAPLAERARGNTHTHTHTHTHTRTQTRTHTHTRTHTQTHTHTHTRKYTTTTTTRLHAVDREPSHAVRPDALPLDRRRERRAGEVDVAREQPQVLRERRVRRRATAAAAAAAPAVRAVVLGEERGVDAIVVEVDRHVLGGEDRDDERAVRVVAVSPAAVLVEARAEEPRRRGGRREIERHVDACADDAPSAAARRSPRRPPPHPPSPPPRPGSPPKDDARPHRTLAVERVAREHGLVVA